MLTLTLDPDRLEPWHAGQHLTNGFRRRSNLAAPTSFVPSGTRP